MTKKNPRITVTLTPEVHALLRRMSELTGNSQSSFVGDLLSRSAPVFSRMVQVLDASEFLRLEALKAPDEFNAGLEQAQTRLESQMGLVLDAMDDGFRPLLEAAEKIKRRSRRRPTAEEATPGAPPRSAGQGADSSKKHTRKRAGR